MKKIFVIILLIITSAGAFAQYKMSRQQYIEKYKDLAIEHMRKYKIPASITLSQGILESGNGGSKLATVANNHFGIKCGTGWQGKTISHDDDAKGECFRKYSSAEESYLDHSMFLTTKTRYAKLFTLEITDYKGWAHGLKAAGYATAPHYATALIKLIEDCNLQQFDVIALKGKEKKPASENPNKGAQQRKLDKYGRERGETNGVKYVLAKQGDSYASISHEEKASLDKLLKYNDLHMIIPLKQGEKVYLKAKKNSSSEAASHSVRQGDTMRSISQKYGIKEKNLKRLNSKIKRREPQTGEVLKLRK